MKIHFLPWGAMRSPPHRQNRGYDQILEGLHDHTDVVLVDDWHDAEAVFAHHYCFAGNMKRAFPGKRTVFFDLDDGTSVQNVNADVYLKRNYLGARGSFSPAREPNVHPFNFMAMDEYFPDEDRPRTIDVCCTLRGGQGLRNEVLKVLRAAFGGRKNVLLNPVSDGGLIGLSRPYLNAMWRSKIVVTCSPCRWEGDNRTFEALASGAMVIMDRHRIVEPAPRNFKHVIYFDDPESIPATVNGYLLHDDERVRIGTAGMHFTRAYHTGKARIQYVFKLLKACSDSS